ncbi:unnamed protein product [Closterium sp. Naga37s-1]|nr:unnamed protein product [Closterium sp. Naga37s-1]
MRRRPSAFPKFVSEAAREAALREAWWNKPLSEDVQKWLRTWDYQEEEPLGEGTKGEELPGEGHATQKNGGGSGEKRGTEEASAGKFQLLCRADMVHYLDVRDGWELEQCECCFDRAVSYRAQRALNMMSLEDFRFHLHTHLPSAVPVAAPNRQSRAIREFASRVPVEALGGRGALVAELGAGKQQEDDSFASLLVQVLGVKESADLQEGFGFFVQHLLSGGLEQAHAEEKGRGRAGGQDSRGRGMGQNGPGADIGRMEGGRVAREVVMFPQLGSPEESWETGIRLMAEAMTRAVEGRSGMGEECVTGMGMGRDGGSVRGIGGETGSGRRMGGDRGSGRGMGQGMGSGRGMGQDGGSGRGMEEELYGMMGSAWGGVRREEVSGMLNLDRGAAMDSFLSAVGGGSGGGGRRGVGSQGDGLMGWMGGGDESENGEASEWGVGTAEAGNGGEWGGSGGGGMAGEGAEGRDGEGGRDGKGEKCREHLKGRVWERLGAIPKPLDQSSIPLEWEEWSRGDEAAGKLPNDPSARCFRLGIVKESGSREEGGGKASKEAGTPGGRPGGTARAMRGRGGKGGNRRGGGRGGRGVDRGLDWGSGSGWGRDTAHGDDSPSFAEALAASVAPQNQKIPIVRCTADAEFLVEFAGYMVLPPSCSHCSNCFSTFTYYLLALTPIANFAYQPASALFNRFVSVFPPHSPEFNDLLASLRMKPLPTDVPALLNLHVVRERAEQLPVFFLLLVALRWPKAMLQIEELKGLGRDEESGEESGEGKGKDKKEEEPAYLKPCPGGVNLVACLREMLLGEPCYRPASPAATSPAAGSTGTLLNVAGKSAPEGSSVEGGGVKLRSCGGCGKVAYCSRECQKAHWPFHKLTCKSKASSMVSGQVFVVQVAAAESLAHRRWARVSARGDLHAVAPAGVALPY